MPDTLKRRIVSIGAISLTAVLLTPLLFVSLPFVAAFDLLLQRRWATCRALTFLVCFAWMEVAGLAGAFALWLARPALNDETWLTHHYRLQRWWALTIASTFVRLYGMRIDVDGDPVGPGPVIVLPRHASVADAVVHFLIDHDASLRPRYVLKDILAWDPCLDVVGNRLPNAFVSRGSGDPQAQAKRIAQLAHDMGPRDALVMYPEGTRYTRARRARLLRRYRDSGNDIAAAEVLAHTHVLPPRPAGTLALLDAAPQADILLVAHSGLDGARGFRDFWHGRLIGQTIRLRVLRYPASHMPRDERGRRIWLRDAWRWMDRTTGELAQASDVPVPAQQPVRQAGVAL
jgi:1-acyl-sn-glycerol-3-phosphate acyltransferase